MGADKPYPCEVCTGETYEKHCKIICKQCGFKIDCSDHL